MLQARDGCLWVGTGDGLARFNGADFSVFRTENTPALPSDNVGPLAEDLAGNLYIGTTLGLTRRNPRGEFTAVPPEAGLAKGSITALAVDSADAVWAGTSRGCFRSLDHGTSFQPIVTGKVIVRNFYQDRDGSMWVAAEQGLYQTVNGSVVRRYTTDDGLASDSVRGVLRDDRGRLWAATILGLDVFGDDGRARNAGPFKGETITLMYQDQPSCLWLASTKRGLVRFVPDSESAVTILGVESLGSIVVSQCAGPDGSRWLGTSADGLLQLRNARVRMIQDFGGPRNDSVTSLDRMPDGSICVGTAYGLFIERPGTARWQVALPGQYIHGVVAEPDGRWLAATIVGVAVVEGPVAVPPPGLEMVREEVTNLWQDRAGRLWVGTVHGLYLKVGDHDTARVSLPGAESLPGIHAIYEDRAGDLWFGVRGGVARLRQGDPAQGQFYGRTEGLVAAAVDAIAEDDDDGSLWFGCLSEGVSRLHDGRFTSCGKKQGLPGTVISQIVDDGRGRFWMGSLDGIFAVAKTDLRRVTDSGSGPLPCEVFGTAEGMATEACYGATPHGGFRAADGTVWFGTHKGVAVVDANVPRPTVAPPPVRIDKALADGAPLASPLSPVTRRTEFSYAGLEYFHPERVRYRYRLLPFDRGWVEAGSRRTAEYTHLSPGQYRFEVTAAGPDGNWNAQPATVAFTLRPHWYQTWWFAPLAAAFVAGVLWIAHQLRVRALAAEHRARLHERERLAHDVHDDFVQALIATTQQVEAARGLLGPALPTAEAASAHLRLAEGILRRTIHEVRDTLAGIHGSAPSRRELVAHCFQLVKEHAPTSEGLLTTSVDPGFDVLPGAVRFQLLRICQEAVLNALRHARPSRISLDVQPAREGSAPRWQCRVQDDGRGFNPDGDGMEGGTRSFGLRGMRERAEKLGGSLEVRSRPGLGTEVTCTVPVPKRRRRRSAVAAEVPGR